jgi:N-acetylglucosaminyl-diphospho-decaprenol L-rhamnosyltransferase
VTTAPTPADLSVIVPHHGDPALADALVTALRRQAPDAEVVVVDDASPRAYPDRDDVRVVRRSRNGGFGAAVNSGAAVAGRPLLLVLNSDLTVGDTFVPDLLGAAAPWLPAVCAPAVVGADGVPAWSGRHFPTVRHQVVEWLTPLARFRPLLHEQVGHDTRCVPGRVEVTDWLLGAALLVPADAFAAVGGFDEGYFMNAEEVDLQRRLRERGLPAVHLGTVVVEHEGGGSSDPERRLRWLLSARRAYARKWHGRRGVTALQAGLTAATGVNLVANGARRLAGREVRPLERAGRELDLIWR